MTESVSFEGIVPASRDDLSTPVAGTNVPEGIDLTRLLMTTVGARAAVLWCLSAWATASDQDQVHAVVRRRRGARQHKCQPVGAEWAMAGEAASIHAP
jgi:hypothetical protein